VGPSCGPELPASASRPVAASSPGAASAGAEPPLPPRPPVSPPAPPPWPADPLEPPVVLPPDPPVSSPAPAAPMGRPPPLGDEQPPIASASAPAINTSAKTARPSPRFPSWFRCMGDTYMPGRALPGTPNVLPAPVSEAEGELGGARSAGAGVGGGHGGAGVDQAFHADATPRALASGRTLQVRAIVTTRGHEVGARATWLEPATPASAPSPLSGVPPLRPVAGAPPHAAPASSRHPTSKRRCTPERIVGATPALESVSPA
jgi:hypothetical protein